MSATITGPEVLAPQQAALVRRHLQEVMASPAFAGSKRAQDFLRLIVEHALEGEFDRLRERMIGVEMFNRPVDYDTANDSVVRVKATETRKKLAQHYFERPQKSTVRIDLPTGSYVPRFAFESLEKATEPASINVPSALIEQPVVIQPEMYEERSRRRADEVSHFLSRKPRRAQRIALWAAVGVAAIAMIGGLVLRESYWQHAKTPIMEVWGPLLTNPGTVLISVGRTHFEDKETPEPPDATVEQHILRPEARISLAAVQAVSQAAGFLQTQHKQFRVHEASSNSLQDLHRLPVVLVSGYNNIWTMRLLQPLRFHFEQVGSLHYIADAQHPELHDWSVEFNAPYVQQREDYAIVARFNNATTDGPVLVIAGIGSNGSQAAGEFIVSPDALEALARSAPHGSLDQNFEAVLKIEVIGGNTGAATVVASQFW
jgi:hypothetical protein